MARVLSLNTHSLSRVFAVPHGWKFTLSVAFAAQVLSAVGYSMMFPFLPLHIETLGTTTGLSTELAAGLVISVQGITMMITAPFWGVAADRFGRKKMIMRAMFGGAITMAMMGFVQTAEQLILIRAIQGMVTGRFPPTTRWWRRQLHGIASASRWAPCSWACGPASPSVPCWAASSLITSVTAFPIW